MKKNISIVVLSVFLALALASSSGAASMLANEHQARRHAESCWSKAKALMAQAGDLYTTTIDYNNAGYQIDAYTAGATNVAVSQYNENVKAYNQECATAATPLQTN